MAERTFHFDLQGHRGARGLKPENTLPAFMTALEIGVTTLEMDVVISGDGLVVVSHDPWFNPAITTKPDGTTMTAEELISFRLFDMPYSEIRRFDCGMRQHPDFPRQQPEPAFKPLLMEVINAAEEFCSATGRAPVAYNIETKSTADGDGFFHPDPETFTWLLVDVLESTEVAHRCTIQSFDIRTLHSARAIETSSKISLLVDKKAGADVSRHFDQLGFVPDIYSPHYKLVTDEAVEVSHDNNCAVLPWTVNEKQDMIELLERGVDGFITDYPDIAKQLLSTE